jgi:hypothetical protein
MKKFLILGVVFLTLFAVMPVAAQTPTGYEFRTGGTGTAAPSTEQAYSGLWSAKLTTTVGNTDFGAATFYYAAGFKLDDLDTFSFCEYVSARAAGTFVDVFVDIWLDFNGNGIADGPGDYPGYLQAEPVYTVGAAPLNTWTCIDAMNLKWSTYVGPDDPYHAPTIADFQNPGSFTPCVHGYDMNDWTNSVDFGNLDIVRIDVRVGYGGTWNNFIGYADYVQINDYVQSFETFNSVGDCTSAYIAANCSDLTGRDRAACNHEQQEECQEMFGVSVQPIE